jgi:hypothetical protein
VVQGRSVLQMQMRIAVSQSWMSRVLINLA